MPVQSEDTEVYEGFRTKQVETLETLNFKPETVIWHYTTGPGLQAILESGTIYATQVACLNDSSEIRYASSLFKNALITLLPKYATEPAVEAFIKRYVKVIEEEPDRPNHAPSPFFVSCFSQQEDDLSQWRSYCGDENGYAIGLVASMLFGGSHNLLVRVNYDSTVHEKLAGEIAEKTVQFFQDGLNKKRAETAEKWGEEFLEFWDPYISKIAPMVKDPGFAAENEYRIIHELQIGEIKDLRFVQKKTLMSRHLPLSFPRGGEAWVPRLPIEKVIVGPCRHREITRISVDTLMRKMGYGSGRVFSSKRPFQET